MREFAERLGRPKLRELVQEASQALARLDANRLEELALSCQALNRDLLGRDNQSLDNLGLGDLPPGSLTRMDGDARRALASEAREATGDLAVFARVLEATRANLEVMSRLRDLRAGQIEYREERFKAGARTPEWPRTENGHGDN